MRQPRALASKAQYSLPLNMASSVTRQIERTAMFVPGGEFKLNVVLAGGFLLLKLRRWRQSELRNQVPADGANDIGRRRGPHLDLARVGDRR